MDEFFKTRMGQRFYESTMPKIADELERLNRNLEKLVEALADRRAVDRQEPEGEGQR
jgi:hypothetical protein